MIVFAQVEKYIKAHPHYDVMLSRIRTGGGINTVVDIGPYRIGWNSLWTPTCRRWYNDASISDEQFVKWLRNYISKAIIRGHRTNELPHELNIHLLVKGQ